MLGEGCNETNGFIETGAIGSFCCRSNRQCKLCNEGCETLTKYSSLG